MPWRSRQVGRPIEQQPPIDAQGEVVQVRHGAGARHGRRLCPTPERRRRALLLQITAPPGRMYRGSDCNGGRTEIIWYRLVGSAAHLR
jgi:hypothetical protein